VGLASEIDRRDAKRARGTFAVLAALIVREPERVELRARFGAETTPGDVQALLDRSITVPMRYPPHITLEELDRDEIVVRIVATPTRPADGARLAAEVLSAVRENGARASAPA
jgi:hypothetical protein